MNVVFVVGEGLGLPAEAWWRVAVLEEPWAAAAVLGLAAVIVIGLGIRQADGTRRRAMVGAGGVCAAMAVGLVVTAAAVRTQREEVMERTAAMIADAARVSESGSADGLRAWLRDDVVVSVFGTRVAVGEDEIAGLAEEYVGREYPVKEHTITRREAVIDSASSARSAARVRATLRDWGLSVSSQWVMHWRLEGEQWRLTQVECVQIDGVSAGDARLPRGGR